MTKRRNERLRQPLAILLIGLFFGGGIGFLLAAANGITLNGHDHSAQRDHAISAPEAPHNDHAHDDMLDLASGALTPTLEISLKPDPVAGWNLNILTTNFDFAPDHAGGKHVAGEGHAHVYVNEVKIARAYGPWMHLSSLPDGNVKISVTLNANDHRGLSVAGTALTDSVTLEN